MSRYNEICSELDDIETSTSNVRDLLENLDVSHDDLREVGAILENLMSSLERQEEPKMRLVYDYLSSLDSVISKMIGGRYDPSMADKVFPDILTALELEEVLANR